MIKAKHTQRSNTETSPIGIPLGSAFIKEAEMWMGAQSDWLTSMEGMMTDWLRRQREAFDVSSRSIQRMYDSRNLIDLVQAQHEWVSDCLHWTASEIRAASNDAVAITRKAAKRLGEVGRERSDGLQPETKAPVKTEIDHPVQRVAAE